jgi:hypothetical protein
MKKNILMVFLPVILFVYANAQEFSMPELQGYKKISGYPVFTAETLWNFIDGAADKYLSFGFIDLNVAEYKKGKNVIKLEIYRHSNNTMAFGIYSSERSSSFRYLNLGAQGYIADGAINFFKGNYYVKLRTYSKNENTLQAEQSLAQRVSDMLPGEIRLPALLSRFPETGKKRNEETFITESVLGHKFLTNAFKAEYEVGSDNFSIYILEKISGEETRKSVDALLKSGGMELSEGDTGKYMLIDGYNGTIFLAYKENEIVIISGLAKDQTAMADQYSSEILK